MEDLEISNIVLTKPIDSKSKGTLAMAGKP
jgi:hypothetical protein